MQERRPVLHRVWVREAVRIGGGTGDGEETGVQGAFGVMPAHLNELSPSAVRSLFPGLVYQLGVLVASPATAVEFMLRDRFGYPWALTMFEGTVIVLMIVIFWLGPEARDRNFFRESEKHSVAG